ncbi:MAG: hypothetical protein EBZ74_09840 [Planctomycetia bacterium]|nr:hypothetical protein [Planctomycetia bacterium]
MERSRGGAELFGFRLGQLVLPSSHHRVPALKGIGQAYESGLQGLGFPPTEAHNSAAIGLLGGLGFLALFPLLVLTRDSDDSGDLVGERFFHKLSVLGVAVFVLGVGGGIGSLMGLVFPLIRAYNRISVFAGFLGLLTIAAAVTLLSQAVSSTRSTLVCTLLCAVLLPLGVLDEVPVGVYDVRSASDDWKALGRFVGQVEQSLPSGAMIFQLPYVPFPENPPVHRMHDYDHLKPYLHSRGIRWSYGAIKGRKVADWQRRVASLPPQEMVAELRGADFRGIWVDRFGYEDSGMTLETSLADALGGPSAIVSADGRYTFFSLD